MSELTTRPATATDAADPAFEDLLPDRWREGENRRSLVATDEAGSLLGHCRGIDNVFHPNSRTLVLEVRPDAPWAEVADALLEAQIAVSTLPLHVKPSAHEAALAALCARHDGVLVQIMPPWRYVVGPALRDWAREHRTTHDGLTATDLPTASCSIGAEDGAVREQMLDLYVEHYTAQHARWSPAVAPEQLRAENAPDFTPGGEGSFAPSRTTFLVRDAQRRLQGGTQGWLGEQGTDHTSRPRGARARTATTHPAKSDVAKEQHSGADSGTSDAAGA